MRSPGGTACQTCSRRGLPCTFSEPKKRGPKSGALAALQQEVNALRAQLLNASIPPVTASAGGAGSKRSRAEDDMAESRDDQGGNGGGGSSRVRRAAAQRALTAILATSDPLDGLDGASDAGASNSGDSRGSAANGIDSRTDSGDDEWGPARDSNSNAAAAHGTRLHPPPPVVPLPPGAVFTGQTRPVSLWPPNPPVAPAAQELHFARLFMRCSNAMLPMVCKVRGA